VRACRVSDGPADKGRAAADGRPGRSRRAGQGGRGPGGRESASLAL
jgi:hypothetical protein